MINIKRFVTLSLILSMMFGLTAGCSLLDDFLAQESFEITKELPGGPVPMAQTPAIPIVLVPSASGTRVEKNAKALIDYSNAADGYVMVKWLTKSTKQLRVLVTGPSGTTYTYVIQANDKYEVFPLSDGNGKYSVGVFEHIDEGRYAQACKVEFTVRLKDEFAPFLRPNQYVNFIKDSNTVKKAAELVTGKRTVNDKVAEVYNFVIKTLSYDTGLAKDITDGKVTSYLPDLDSVLARKKGICFDYAALMTAMLRSQDIPTKLVVGYTGEIRHAWISVYSKETGWIDSIIHFDGKTWTMMDPTFASSAGNSASLKAFIGDGKNYVTTHLY